MDETRAVARLPHLDIEIRHRKASDESAEYLSVSLRAAPDLKAATSLLDPLVLLAAWTAFNPWLAWAQLMNPFGMRRLGAPHRKR
jgi:hypothetical protein